MKANELNFSIFCETELGIHSPITCGYHIEGVDRHTDTITLEAVEILRECYKIVKIPREVLRLYVLLLQKVNDDKYDKTRHISKPIDTFYNRLPSSIALDYIKNPKQYGVFTNQDIIQLINSDFL